MKASNRVALALSTVGILAATSSCSHMPGTTEAGKEISATGPTIMNPRVEPTTVEMNRRLQPTQTPEILADVKDFKSKIVSVKLKFQHVPLEVPMTNIGGTTWRANLTPAQVRDLAVSGQTVTYDAAIIAQNEAGQTSTSTKSVTLAIKTPDLATVT